MKKQLLYTLSASLLLGACTKKLDNTYDNRPVQLPNTPSTSRIMNLVGATELQINGDRLTSFLPPSFEGEYGAAQTKGTRWFPENGRLGSSFTIPKELFKNGLADSIQFSTLSPKIAVPPKRPFKVVDDEFNTFDYYYTRFIPNTGGFQDSLFRIPRNISSPANPAAFKIRLINLSTAPGPFTIAGLFRKGPMSVVLADGTSVPGLSNVAPGTYSDYVEMPFGTYQFKVMDSDGKGVPGTGGGYNMVNPTTGTLMDDFSGTISLGGHRDTWLTFAPVRTYQPGGVYTIVVGSSYDSRYPNGNPNGETIPTENNLFRIISDISEPLNLTYARIQGVNTIPSGTVKWKVDGQPISETLSFTQSSDYATLIAGKHQLQAIGQGDKILIDTAILMAPGDNLTAWAYAGNTGAVGVTITMNNLSGKYYNGRASDDATNSTFKDPFPFWVRFMNFCADLREVSFMGNDGQQFPSSIQETGTGNRHVPFAKGVSSEPYIRMFVNFTNDIMAYASQPTVMPGDWIRSVPVVKSQRFVAKPELYKGTPLPGSEPGVYTVALVGSLSPNATAAEKARMVIVKHTK